MRPIEIAFLFGLFPGIMNSWVKNHHESPSLTGASAAVRASAPSRAIVWLRDASQIRAVLSSDAVTMRCPSGLNEALQLVWPSKALICFPVAASQMRAVVSEDAVTMRWLSELNEALFTALV